MPLAFFVSNFFKSVKIHLILALEIIFALEVECSWGQSIWWIVFFSSCSLYILLTWSGHQFWDMATRLRNAKTFSTNIWTPLSSSTKKESRLSNFLFILIEYMNLPYPVVNLLRIEGNSFITLVVKITDFLKTSSYWTGHAQWQQHTITSDAVCTL